MSDEVLDGTKKPVSTGLARKGCVLLAAGGIFGLVGLMGMIRFYVSYMSSDGQMTGDQMGRAAAMPHILMVLGLGFLIFGVILVLKARVLRDERDL